MNQSDEIPADDQSPDVHFETPPFPTPGLLPRTFALIGMLSLVAWIVLLLAFLSGKKSGMLSWSSVFFIPAVSGISQLAACLRPTEKTAEVAVYLPLLLGIIPGIFYSIFATWLIASGSGISWQEGTRLLVSIYLAISGLLLRPWQRRVKAYEEAHLLCHICHYDLRGTLAAGIRRCPECGAPLKS